MDRTLILIVGTLVMTLSIMTLLVFIIYYQKKVALKNNTINRIQDNLAKSEIAAKQNYIEGQGIEKKRIARELHDGIGSELTILKLKNNKNPHYDFGQDIDNILRQIRTISHALNKGIFAYENLELQLNSYIREVSHSSLLLIKFESYGLTDIIYDEIGHHIYRIIQELIQNTVKHASASEVYIEINYHKMDSLSLLYMDNGCGIGQNLKSSMKQGIGLRNIEERVKKLNGTMKIMKKNTGFELLVNCRFQ